MPGLVGPVAYTHANLRIMCHDCLCNFEIMAPCDLDPAQSQFGTGSFWGLVFRFEHSLSKTLAWDLGAGSEHHDAGVVRHPTKRKIFRTWPLMATGAVSFRLPSLPMAPAEMREKTGPFMYVHAPQVAGSPQVPLNNQRQGEGRGLCKRTWGCTHKQAGYPRELWA